MQHRATLHAMTPQRLQDCWEDAQTSEAGRTTLRKNTPMTEAHAMGKSHFFLPFLVRSLLLEGHAGGGRLVR